MSDSLCNDRTLLLNRRDILRHSACGFGWMAFGSLAHQASAALAAAPAAGPLAPKAPHFPAKAKRVIFLCMRGGPSHVDTFDYKPKLNADSGKPGPKPGSALLGSPWKFQKRGKSGLWMSELFPALGQRADDLCMIHSMQTDIPAHPQAYLRLHTGSSQFVRPSLGAWSMYGLGTVNQNLPGFVSITPANGFGGVQNYGSAFLPAIYQGTRFGQDNRPVKNAQLANLRPRSGAADQRAELDFIQGMNHVKQAADGVNPEVDGTLESYELAFRMQSEMPGVLDFSKETPATLARYGIGNDATDNFGRKCLMARRMAEAGVRFIEVTHGNWDHHFNLTENMTKSCAEVDLPVAGLLADLKERGMLDDTLVVFTGEFGRTPYAEGQNGRDHNTKAFTLWMAGGGVKGGFSHGQSDDYGHETVADAVPIVDLHATMLALLGLDHEKLTYRHAGRDFRLTDTKGRVVKEVMA